VRKRNKKREREKEKQREKERESKRERERAERGRKESKSRGREKGGRARGDKEILWGGDPVVDHEIVRDDFLLEICTNESCPTY